MKRLNIRIAHLLACLAIYIISVQALYACSCSYLGLFCERYQEATEIAVFKGVVVHKTYYDETNEAIYVKVLKKYRDDYQITDVVKLYGASGTCCYCDVPLFNVYEVEDTLFVLFDYEREPHFNPAASYEDYYENYIVSCNSIILNDANGLVTGKIWSGEVDEDFVYISEYPSDKFEEALTNCNFDAKELRDFHCADNQYTVWPNPLVGNTLKITTDLRTHTFDEVRILAYDGEVVWREENGPYRFENHIELPSNLNGVYFVQIRCGDFLKVKRIVVLN